MNPFQRLGAKISNWWKGEPQDSGGKTTLNSPSFLERIGLYDLDEEEQDDIEDKVNNGTAKQVGGDVKPDKKNIVKSFVNIEFKIYDACPMFTDDRKYQLKCRAGA